MPAPGTGPGDDEKGKGDVMDREGTCVVDVYRVREGGGVAITTEREVPCEAGHEAALCEQRGRGLALGCACDSVYVVSVWRPGDEGSRRNLLVGRDGLGEMRRHTSGGDGLWKLLREAEEILERPVRRTWGGAWRRLAGRVM